MKKTFLFVLGLCMMHAAISQSNKQVRWTYNAKKISDKTYEVHMVATINGDYHLYAQDVGGEGPIPTTFTFTKNPLLQLDGKIKEVGKTIKKFESAWNHDVNYYEKNVDFVQVVKIKGNAKTNLSGKVEFMVCNEQKCLPPSDVEIKIN